MRSARQRHNPSATTTAPRDARVEVAPACQPARSCDAMRLVLASASPRRRQLLADADVAFTVVDPGVDDGAVEPGAVAPAALVMALAYLKARAGAERLDAEAISCASRRVVLGADTIVVKDGLRIGQPRDAADAQRIIRLLRGGEHVVITGVALVSTGEPSGRGRRWLGFDAARVAFGSLTDDAVEGYVESGAWRGKAGAYNYADRLAAGWPVACVGDVATVMGLPMRLLPDWLAAFTAAQPPPDHPEPRA